MYRNVALVEEQHIQFQPGLNVITGESGAGKSILVTALGLALGSAASPDTIRAPAKQAAVEATFKVQGHGQVWGSCMHRSWRVSCSGVCYCEHHRPLFTMFI